MAEDSELWDIVLDGPFIPMMEEKDGEKTNLVPKPRQKYDEADRKKIEKGYKAKTLLVCGIGPDEFNRVSACESAKEIWDCLKTAHEGTEQVKESKIDMLTSRYENFKMKEGETIHDMFTKLSSITNELRSLGEPISMTKQVRKVLRILPKSWESKVDVITEAKDLKVLTMDALIGNLKIHEMNRNYDLSKKEAKKDKSLMLKYKSDEDSSDDDMGYLISSWALYQRVSIAQERKQGTSRTRSDKENRRDLVLGKRDRRAAADLVVKKALAAWGDSSSDSEDPDEPNDVSMWLYMRRKPFSMKCLLSWLIQKMKKRTTKDTMNAELDSLTENKVKLEDKMSRMVSLESDNSELKNQLNQIIEEAEKLNGMSNGLQAEIQEKLKNSEKNLGLSLGKSNKLEKDIVKLKDELENSLKWTKSSKLLSNATNQSNFNKKGLGSLNITPPYNPHSKESVLAGETPTKDSNYAERKNLPKERPGPPKHVSTHRFSKKKSVTAPMSFVSERSSSQCWYMDSGCSKHMTGDVKNFLSLNTLQGGGVSFGDGKKGYILGVGKVGRSLEDSIDNVYNVDGLKYSLLSVSQICDKGNEVKFTSEKCTVVSLTTKKVILTAQRSKNMYVANLETSHGDDLTCLSSQNENADLWHRRLGHVSSSLLNKLISKDLVRGLPKLEFAENKICEACVKGKQIRSSFKPKKQVNSSRTLELLHMDLCGPLKVQSRNDKKYILVIVDDYSR
ncbi:sporulation-specific protein 15-like [Solanum lycopersicum]|uniref:sporulation-specific protein 15-like n=1 Tax=Solanum lycopersicum TaxID=4081 RepID=UPI003749D453